MFPDQRWNPHPLQSLNHWTAREVPHLLCFKSASSPPVYSYTFKEKLVKLEFRLGKILVEAIAALLQKLSTGAKATSGGQGRKGCIQDAGVQAGKAQVCTQDALVTGT